MCISRLFENQVKNTPEVVAVVLGQERMSYGELNGRANQLAHYLRSRGVGPEVVVGVCAERSLELVVAILGILKAGGAYVPLDPEYPRELLDHMLKESGAALLLSQLHLADVFSRTGVPQIHLDGDWRIIDRESVEDPEQYPTDNDLAYIMFTSGSTGWPKAVQVCHRALYHYVRALGPALGLCPGDVYLHTASFSFSSSLRQLLVPLAAGSKVEIATLEQSRDPLGLLKLIQDKGVTFHDTVQSVWRHAVLVLRGIDSLSKKRLLKSSLKCIVFSGDLLTFDLLRAMKSELVTMPRIINIYGQTETIGVSVYTVPPPVINGPIFSN